MKIRSGKLPEGTWVEVGFPRILLQFAHRMFQLPDDAGITIWVENMQLLNTQIKLSNSIYIKKQTIIIRRIIITHLICIGCISGSFNHRYRQRTVNTHLPVSATTPSPNSLAAPASHHEYCYHSHKAHPHSAAPPSGPDITPVSPASPYHPPPYPHSRA